MDQIMFLFYENLALQDASNVSAELQEEHPSTGDGFPRIVLPKKLPCYSERVEAEETVSAEFISTLPFLIAVHFIRERRKRILVHRIG